MPAHLQGCKHLAPPLDVHALDRLETLLKSGEIAAFIFEPIVTNLNVLIPDAELVHGISELCHAHGTLVIADEVACGFGRTGTLFACELFDLEPDLLCLAKAIAAGVAPIAATLCTNDVAKAVAASDVDFSHYSTFGWHPVAVEAALATQQMWREHRAEILGNVAERSTDFRHALSIMDWKNDAALDLRIQGLAIGVGVGSEDYARAIADRCRDHGLLLYAEEDSLVLFPPLVIDDETTQEALAILSQAVRDA
jgi:putrescine aminotransferase